MSKIRITFGILSVRADCEVVQQQVDVLGQHHRIIIHHDFGQAPDFYVEGANCQIIRDYVPTDWGRWSQLEAILKILQVALKTTDFDYIQLLSESCLPVRPLAEFEDYLSEDRPDANIGLMPIGAAPDDVGRLNYAWRYQTNSRWASKAVGRAATWCRDPDILNDKSRREVVGGLAVVPAAVRKNVLNRFKYAIGNAIISTATCKAFASHPFSERFRCYVGSTWFCLSRNVVQHVLETIADNSKLVTHYRETRSPDESIIHTIVGNSKFSRIRDLNHVLFWRTRSTGPDILSLDHYTAIRASDKFFARKFDIDLRDPLRQKVLTGIRA